MDLWNSNVNNALTDTSSRFVRSGHQVKPVINKGGWNHESPSSQLYKHEKQNILDKNALVMLWRCHLEPKSGWWVGLMTYSAARHQGATKMFWLHILAALMLTIFIYIMWVKHGETYKSISFTSLVLPLFSIPGSFISYSLFHTGKLAKNYRNTQQDIFLCFFLTIPENRNPAGTQSYSTFVFSGNYITDSFMSNLINLLLIYGKVKHSSGAPCGADDADFLPHTV